jgi:hypothetical protein
MVVKTQPIVGREPVANAGGVGGRVARSGD